MKFISRNDRARYGCGKFIVEITEREATTFLSRETVKRLEDVDEAGAEISLEEDIQQTNDRRIKSGEYESLMKELAKSLDRFKPKE
jgi:hypothetical protein